VDTHYWSYKEGAFVVLLLVGLLANSRVIAEYLPTEWNLAYKCECSHNVLTISWDGSHLLLAGQEQWGKCWLMLVDPEKLIAILNKTTLSDLGNILNGKPVPYANYYCNPRLPDPGVGLIDLGRGYVSAVTWDGTNYWIVKNPFACLQCYSNAGQYIWSDSVWVEAGQGNLALETNGLGYAGGYLWVATKGKNRVSIR
jgi:hypothetical protein